MLTHPQSLVTASDLAYMQQLGKDRSCLVFPLNITASSIGRCVFTDMHSWYLPHMCSSLALLVEVGRSYVTWLHSDL